MEQADRARIFREALGTFPTGVTIVTTRGRDQVPVGVTASSFNSVSINPPLVLWSLAKAARSHDDFCNCEHFAVHVLNADQIDLSNRFARSGEDKFNGLNWTEGLGRAPILPDAAALFQCRTMHRYEGGDHLILVGEVMAFERSDGEPLLFHRGRYAEARKHLGRATAADTIDLDTASFSDDFLLYLLGRAYYQIIRPSREIVEAHDLSDAEYAVFGRLSMVAPIPADALIAQMAHTGLGVDADLLDRLCARNLIERTREGLRLSGAGKAIFLEALSVAKAQEEELLGAFTPGESADLKYLLRKLIEASGADVPIAWRR